LSYLYAQDDDGIGKITMRWIDMAPGKERRYMKRFALKLSEWNLMKFKTGGMVAAALLVGVAMLHSTASMAQPAPASVHGLVTNPAGVPLGTGEVRLTTDRSGDAKNRKFPYTFKIDPTGNFKGTGIAPGDYVAIVFQDDKSLDFIDSVKLAAGDDKTVNFDMTRKEYVDKMTPEERKALEEYKKQAAAQIAANSKIQNLNAMLAQARTDTKAGNFDPAIKSMQQAVTLKPDEAILWIALADAQLGAADAAAKAAKAAGKPTTDPDISKMYTDAAASYQKGLDLNAASKKPSPDTAGTAYNQMGQAYARMGDTKSSADAYENAAKAQPAQAAMYYYNEAATFYNVGKNPEAAVAADKAIAADPKRADAYYLKGQALIPNATVDPKTQKIVAPPDCVAAYQMYLELAPTGPHAEEVKAILAGIGEQVKSTYKAPKK
jgi:tetratricopeptide (TPR) repeat protein